MAYAQKTLSDCHQSLADRHDNGTVPNSSSILARYTRLINRGVEYCADRMRMSTPASVVVTSGVGDLGTDFIIVNSVFNASGQALTLVDPEDQSVQRGLVYWITGNARDGYDLNVPDDGTYTVNKAFKPQWMSSTSDACIIPDIEAPVAYAYAMLRKSESDPFEDAEAALQECDSRIAEMNSQLSMNEDAIGFTLDFEHTPPATWWDTI